MSFKLDYKTLRNRNFQSGVSKLMRHGAYGNVKTTYNISRMGDLIAQEMRTADQLMEKMFKHYVEMDDMGRPVREGDGWKLKEGADKDAFQKEFEEYLGHEVKIERHKIDIDVLDKVGLSPIELSALSPVLREVQEVNADG